MSVLLGLSLSVAVVLVSHVPVSGGRAMPMLVRSTGPLIVVLRPSRSSFTIIQISVLVILDPPPFPLPAICLSLISLWLSDIL